MHGPLIRCSSSTVLRAKPKAGCLVGSEGQGAWWTANSEASIHHRSVVNGRDAHTHRRRPRPGVLGSACGMQHGYCRDLLFCFAPSDASWHASVALSVAHKALSRHLRRLFSLSSNGDCSPSRSHTAMGVSCDSLKDPQLSTSPPSVVIRLSMSDFEYHRICRPCTASLSLSLERSTQRLSRPKAYIARKNLCNRSAASAEVSQCSPLGLH